MERETEERLVERGEGIDGGCIDGGGVEHWVVGMHMAIERCKRRGMLYPVRSCTKMLKHWSRKES